MNLIFAHFFTRTSPQSCRSICRLLSATLCLLLFTAVPALADPVRVNQVIQTLSSSQGTSDLKLSALVTQDPASPKAPIQTGPRNDSVATQGGTKPTSIISGVTVSGETQRIGVDIIEEGEVEGTICDCGEILVAGGAFPKWPFLFLGAVPLVFINNCDDCDEQTSSTPTPTPTPTPPSNPTPTPTPPEVPEPASLLLFGTGLVAVGAGLRRRLTKAKLVEPIRAEEEE